MNKCFISTFDYKVIYVFRINDDNHRGYLKVGDATVHTTSPLSILLPNSRELNQAAKDRINTYTSTAGIVYDLLYTEIAVYNRKYNDGSIRLKAFRDHDVHKVLTRSGISNHFFNTELRQNEWFKTDLETVKRAITAVKSNHSSLSASEITTDMTPIEFRFEQEDAITKTIKQFKVSNRMLWNAKMRFGKTLSALEAAKRCKFKKTLIFTHRPVVSDGWYEDFKKIFYDTDYKFGSKTVGEKIENLIDNDDINFVYFASIQDLRGSSAVGGKFDKNEYIFLLDWDFVVVDEAHEGTQTTLGQKVFEAILSSQTKVPKLLELSGTPFNLLNNFDANEIFTWDYIMEQRAKQDWALTHFGDYNPYDELPKLQIYTYDLDKLIPNYVDLEDCAFNFKEFFRTWTGDVAKDYKIMPSDVIAGDFVHKADVLKLLDLMTTSNEVNNFPYSTEEFRSFFRHTLWMVPGVKEAAALSKLMQAHPVFGCGQFRIINVAGNGDEDTQTAYNNALTAVREAIGPDPDDHYTITISCGRLTTGVTVPEWTAVFMLAGSFSTSASNYMQTIFRVQTPANINGRIKENCYVFDFAPDRTLKMVAEAGQLSAKVGDISNDRVLMREFLNFCPVISLDGSNMLPYNVDGLLQQLKKAYTDRVVRNGFDDNRLYNDYLLKLDDIELADFEKLKKIVGVSKQTKKVEDIDINDQGFTDEEYAIIRQAAKKPKRELTDYEKALLEERKNKLENAQKAKSILRGVSIRIPLLIYGANVPFDSEINCENFVKLIDDSSWAEFMPNGVTKALFAKFTKYYDADIFVAAGRQIRNMAKSADELPPTERVKKIASLFAMFKNPDKETVLTPWRVVNMHMGDCLGGYNFFNTDYSDTIDEPRYIEQGNVTKDVFNNTSKILEINSKTGLYPLYVTYSIFRSRCEGLDHKTLTLDKLYEIWMQTVEDNVYVICKTPMARQITKRTLLGYRNGKTNAHAFDDLINQLKEKPQQFREKILRGSFWNKGDKEMKFNAIVGNPPYQETVNNTSDSPVYYLFMSTAFAISDIVSFISPARFLFNAGKTPKEWNERILNDEHFRVVHYLANSTDVFPNVDIKGGVAITLHNNKERYGTLGVYMQNDTLKGILNKVLESSFISLSNSVYAPESYRFSSILHSENPLIMSKLSEGHLYDITSNIFDKIPEIFYEEKTPPDYIGIFGRLKNKRIVLWLKARYVESHENLLFYKVFIPKSNGSGAYGEVLSSPVIGQPYIGHNQTFISVGKFATEIEASYLLKYIKTKFTRALLGILKVTQDNKKSVWKYVPLQDFTDKSDIDWTKSVADIDQQLYEKYGLDESEIEFIETKVKPME